MAYLYIRVATITDGNPIRAKEPVCRASDFHASLVEVQVRPDLFSNAIGGKQDPCDTLIRDTAPRQPSSTAATRERLPAAKMSVFFKEISPCVLRSRLASTM